MDPELSSDSSGSQTSRTTPTVTRNASSTLPESLRTGPDADQDVTAPKTRRGQLMNQSFLSMIANVGTNPTFSSRISSDVFTLTPASPSRRTVADDSGSHHSRPAERHGGGYALGKSLHHISAGQGRHKRLASVDEHMSASQILPPKTDMSQPSSRETANLRRAEESSPSRQMVSEEDVAESEQATNLNARIAGIFGFEEQEDVLADFPCSLLQSIMLQGHLYITRKHVCFYAYLPRRVGMIAKSGHLNKRGRQSPKYNRFWFVLKGDVLSYYSSDKDLYFPHGTIDLRGQVTAEMTGSKNLEQATAFTVTTAQRQHLLRADSPANAREWVKQLQKVIFRSQNDSDSVKICLPIDNLLDVEESPVLDFATTIRLKVIDNDETYALDEYFFSFYANGVAALDLLRERVTDNAATKDLAAISASQHFPNDNAPQTEPISAENNPSTKLGPQLQSVGRSGDGVARDDEEHESPFATSSSLESDVSDNQQSDDPAGMAASQILGGSDMFRRPTIRPDRHKPVYGTPNISKGKRLVARPIPARNFEQSKSSDEEEIQTSPRAPGGGIMQRPIIKESSSSSTLQGLIKAGAYPLQKASGIAGLLRTHSRQVGTLLATESRGYYERVSGMWAGKRMHYDETEGPILEQPMSDGEDGKRNIRYGDRFRLHFSLPLSEKLVATFFGYLQGAVLIYGKLYVGERKLCFRSLIPGIRTKMILPLKDVENVDKETGFRFGYSGLCLVVRGHEELFFEFSRPETRDDFAITLLQSLESTKALDETGILSPKEQTEASTAKAEYDALLAGRRRGGELLSKQVQQSTYSETSDSSPVLFDDMAASIVNFKPDEPQRITCLTIGSRGDVQPCIALCKGLIAEGHKAKIATHSEFEPWVRSHGIEFEAVAGEPAEIMRLCVENDMFTVSFFREALSKFTGWIDELLESAWHACQDTDILIESPSAMAGIHIAEALQIPYFRAFTMPWTRTRAYPHAFTVPNQKMGGNYNSFSYVMFDNLFWAPISGQVNRWRRKSLGLPAITLDRMAANKAPFLYNFSPSVVAPPLDFNHWIHITGYWFLDEGRDYVPPRKLAGFIEKARSDAKKIVYIGFGSIVVEDPAALTKTIIAAVLKADVRCILSKGWSERLGTAEGKLTEVPLPPSMYQIRSAPHDWLFRQVDAAVHHGGAGTTGASLRAGIPTVVKPFFGDQFFFGSRVEDLGVGLCLKKINTTTLARAMWLATHSERMIVKARVLGQKIRSEDGVGTAIQAIYRDLEYAKSLIKPRQAAASADESEECWELIDEQSDSEMTRHLDEPVLDASAERRLSQVDMGSASDD